MNPWFREAGEVLRGLAGDPASAGAWVLFGAVALVTALLLLKLMALAVGNPRGTWLMNGLALVLCGTLLLAAVCAGRIFLAPLVAGQIETRWVDLVTAVAGLALLATPAFCLLQRTRYLTGIMSLLVALMAAALAVLLTGSMHRGKTLEKIEERTERLQEHLAP